MASALEFMDIMLEKNLKQLLIPVMEYGVRLASGIDRQVAPSKASLRGQEFSSIKRILGGRDLRLKLAVIYLIGHLGDERYVSALMRLQQSPDQRLQDMASRALERLTPGIS